MKITYPGLQKTRARLQLLADNLRDAAGGEVVAEAAAEVQVIVNRIAGEKAGRHVDSGAAKGSIVVSTSGGLIQLRSVDYLRYHGWWPFRRGMPAFVVKSASIIFANKLLAAIGGSDEARAAATVLLVEEEAAAAKRTRVKLQREIDKLARAAQRKARKAVERQTERVRKGRQGG